MALYLIVCIERAKEGHAIICLVYLLYASLIQCSSVWLSSVLFNLVQVGHASVHILYFFYNYLRNKTLKSLFFYEF